MNFRFVFTPERGQVEHKKHRQDACATKSMAGITEHLVAQASSLCLEFPLAASHTGAGGELDT